MALHISGIIFDELTSDPSSPVDGEVWYNTTEDRLKYQRSGTIESVLDKDEFDAHLADVANPHSVDLEQARTAGATLSGAIDMGGFKITNVGTPTAATDAANQSFVKDQIDSKLRGLDWQESVLDRDLATPPGTPAVGDRYIVATGGTGAWASKDGQVTEWDGTSWIFSVPNEGFAVRVEDEDVLLIHDGTSFGPFGSAIDHGNLVGLADDDHTQYLLVSGARAMTGALDMGTFAITNVGNVDGVDVSAHAARHIDGGADAIDGDKVEITFVPTNYTRSTSPAEVDALDQLTAHLAGINDELAGVGMFLVQKAGHVLAASFTGSPKKATVAFSSAFADADYAVIAIAVTSSNTTFNPAIESQVAGSFVINLGSNATTNLTQVNWIAMKDGEA